VPIPAARANVCEVWYYPDFFRRTGADLFRTMTAYAGTYKFDGSKVEHHIDLSSNEVWTGTTQVRSVKRDGERLVYTTPPFHFHADGKMSVNTLIWEKVK
jgi:hypothetical protein